MSRRPLLLSLFLCLIVFAAAWSQDTAVRQLAPGVYYWQGDPARKLPANCTWIVFKDYVLAIDANFAEGAREIIPLIKKTSDKPIRFVFDTHWHGDHTGGNPVWVEAGAAVICSTACADDMRKKPNPNNKTVPPTISFVDRMEFDDGEHRVELTRMGPAHSRGDAVAYLPKEKILVMGDLCVNWKSGNNMADPDADHDNWIRVLDNLIQWDVRTVVPGHGSLGTTDILRVQRAYLADMVNQVRAGIRAGKSVEELVKSVDLSRNGSFASADHSNSIRAVYRKSMAK